MQCTINYDDDFDTPKVFSSYIHKANKQHICNECGRTINKNEEYEVAKGLWGNRFSTFKTCIDCLSLRDTFFENYQYTTVWNDFFEHLAVCFNDDLFLNKLESLTHNARNKVFLYMEELEA